MTKTKKILSLLLTVALLLSTLVVSGLITASAADETVKAIDLTAEQSGKTLTVDGTLAAVTEDAPFGDYTAYAWENGTSQISHVLQATGAKTLSSLNGKKGLEFLFSAEELLEKLEITVMVEGVEYTQTVTFSPTYRNKTLLIPLPFDMFFNAEGDVLADPAKIDMSNGSIFKFKVDCLKKARAIHVKISDIYAYSGDYPAMTLPEGGQELNVPFIPETTEPQTGNGSKTVMSFNPKAFNMNDGWVGQNLVLPNTNQRVFHSAPFDFKDDEGFSFPSYLNVYEITQSRRYMEHQLRLETFDGSILTGSKGLETFVYFNTESSTQKVTPMLFTLAYDENGNPVTDDRGNVKKVVYKVSETAINEVSGCDPITGEIGVITRLQMPWSIFELQNLSSNPGVVETLSGPALDKILASAYEFRVSFSYYYVDDSVAGFDPETGYAAGPHGYLSDIRTYTAAEEMVKQDETLPEEDLTDDDDNGVWDPLEGIDPDILSEGMRKMYDLMTYLPADPTQVTVDDYYTILALFDVYNNELTELDLMMFDSSWYLYLMSLQEQVSMMDTSGRPIVNPGTSDVAPFAGIAILALGGAGVIVAGKKRKKK